MNLYQAFHDWRVRLLQKLQRIETATLKTLRGDMVRTLEMIDRELERRGENQNGDWGGEII